MDGDTRAGLQPQIPCRKGVEFESKKERRKLGFESWKSDLRVQGFKVRCSRISWFKI
jgi:hypothetical protein